MYCTDHMYLVWSKFESNLLTFQEARDPQIEDRFTNTFSKIFLSPAVIALGRILTHSTQSYLTHLKSRIEDFLRGSYQNSVSSLDDLSDDMTDKILACKDVTLLYAVSGSGKTRQLESFPEKKWGFYFTPANLDITGRDIEHFRRTYMNLEEKLNRQTYTGFGSLLNHFHNSHSANHQRVFKLIHGSSTCCMLALLYMNYSKTKLWPLGCLWIIFCGRNVSWKSCVSTLKLQPQELNIGDADTAKELSCTGVITLYILSIATFIVLQSVSPQPTDKRPHQKTLQNSKKLSFCPAHFGKL